VRVNEMGGQADRGEKAVGARIGVASLGSKKAQAIPGTRELRGGIENLPIGLFGLRPAACLVMFEGSFKRFLDWGHRDVLPLPL
jgi:hypothetical protein